MKKSSVKEVTPKYNPKVKNVIPASADLQHFIGTQLGKQIPKALITGLAKHYGKNPIPSDNKFLQRLSESNGFISTAKLQQALKTKEQYIKGQPISDEAMKRIHKSYSSSQGKLSFEYIVKMGESVGIPILPKTAKLVVKKFGKKKDHLSVEDCLRLMSKRRERASQQGRSKIKSANK